MRLTTQRILRAYLRDQLGTWPEGVPLEEWVDRNAVVPVTQRDRTLGDLLNRLRAIGELFVGMANGPFLLVLRASDPQRFIRYADQRPTHNVHITFDIETNEDIVQRNAGVQATIRPADMPDAYSLFFGLPRVLREHVLFDETRGIRLAPGLKRRFFSDITVYRRVADRDLLYRLTYEPQAIRRWPNDVTR